MINDLFNYIYLDRKVRNGQTLYAHNLGRFDSVIILKSLARGGYDVRAKCRNNDILSVKI